MLSDSDPPVWVRLQLREERALGDALSEDRAERLGRGIQQIIGKYGSEADIDEIMNDTLLIVWEKADQFRGQTSQEFDRWVYSIARNLALDFVRRERTRELIEQAQPAPDWITSPGGPNDPFVQLAVEEVLHQVIARYSKDDRELLDMYFLQGKTYEQLAKHLGVSTSTAYGRVQAIKRELRRRMPTR